MAVPEVPVRPEETLKGLHPLSPEALKQEGYSRNRQEKRTSPNLTWEEQYPIDFRLHPSPAIMIMEREREDKQDPAHLLVNGDENFEKYAAENEDELRLLDAKLRSLGIRYPAAGTLLATWGERGHAFEIGKSRVCIYLCFPVAEGDERTRIMELRFSKDAIDRPTIAIWNYQKISLDETPYFDLKELTSRDIVTGELIQRLTITGKNPGHPFKQTTIDYNGLAVQSGTRGY